MFDLETNHQTFIGEYRWRIGSKVYKFKVHQARVTFPKRIEFNGATYVAVEDTRTSDNGRIRIAYRTVRHQATDQVATEAKTEEI